MQTATVRVDPPEPLPLVEARGRGPFVVVAEDDDDIREALTSALRDEGFFVHAVSDGELLTQYLDACQVAGNLPDVIVTDHRMPGYTGVEVLEGLQFAGWNVPVIMLTAFGKDVRALAQTFGALAVFDKPFDLDDFRTAVLWAVNWRHKQLRGANPAKSVNEKTGPKDLTPVTDVLKRCAKSAGLFVCLLLVAANFA